MNSCCGACGAIDAIDVGDDGEPEWLCRGCILQNIEDFTGELTEPDFDLAPYQVGEST